MAVRGNASPRFRMTPDARTTTSAKRNCAATQAAVPRSSFPTLALPVARAPSSRFRTQAAAVSRNTLQRRARPDTRPQTRRMCPTGFPLRMRSTSQLKWRSPRRTRSNRVRSNRLRRCRCPIYTGTRWSPRRIRRRCGARRRLRSMRLRSSPRCRRSAAATSFRRARRTSSPFRRRGPRPLEKHPPMHRTRIHRVSGHHSSRPYSVSVRLRRERPPTRPTSRTQSFASSSLQSTPRARYRTRGGVPVEKPGVPRGTVEPGGGDAGERGKACRAI